MSGLNSMLDVSKREEGTGEEGLRVAGCRDVYITVDWSANRLGPGRKLVRLARGNYLVFDHRPLLAEEIRLVATACRHLDSEVGIALR